ncbi:TetR/AcrR family transcriptional regulator [Rugosimonospora africana]|uniref:TetR/AcrR family transcriptional regulator n=1 Tax=Rugosimonospora africana TaxID=556532 RepID=UPI0019459271|nr:TetR/AcrR family transcriptional regulator [Rugosimonospora africana]
MSPPAEPETPPAEPETTPAVSEAPPARYRHDDGTMLDAACVVFAAEGFSRANMDVIAARAGTTKPTLYARFGPKEKLFAAAVRREHELLNARVTVAYAGGTDEPFHERLHRWTAAYFDFVKERPDGFKLTFEGERHAAAAAVIERATNERIDRIAELVADVSGRPAGPGPRIVAAMIVGMLRWCVREAVAHPGVDLDDAAALCESMVYRAVRGLDLALMDAVGA